MHLGAFDVPGALRRRPATLEIAPHFAVMAYCEASVADDHQFPSARRQAAASAEPELVDTPTPDDSPVPTEAGAQPGDQSAWSVLAQTAFPFAF